VLLLEDRPVRLKNLLGTVQSRQALICSFLALLEMVRLQAILLRQERMFGDIIVKKHAEFEKILTEEAKVRDDWK
jgi:segregation and condensation protein A